MWLSLTREAKCGAIVGELLSVVLSEIGCEELEALNPWYCPSIDEVSLGLLKQHGFDVPEAVINPNSPPRRWQAGYGKFD